MRGVGRIERGQEFAGAYLCKLKLLSADVFGTFFDDVQQADAGHYRLLREVSLVDYLFRIQPDVDVPGRGGYLFR